MGELLGRDLQAATPQMADIFMSEEQPQGWERITKAVRRGFALRMKAVPPNKLERKPLQGTYLGSGLPKNAICVFPPPPSKDVCGPHPQSIYFLWGTCNSLPGQVEIALSPPPLQRKVYRSASRNIFRWQPQKMQHTVPEVPTPLRGWDLSIHVIPRQGNGSKLVCVYVWVDGGGGQEPVMCGLAG